VSVLVSWARAKDQREKFPALALAEGEVCGEFLEACFCEERDFIRSVAEGKIGLIGSSILCAYAGSLIWLETR